MLGSLNLPNLMEARKFLNIPEEDIIYEIPEDNQIITELVEIFNSWFAYKVESLIINYIYVY